ETEALNVNTKPAPARDKPPTPDSQAPTVAKSDPPAKPLATAAEFDSDEDEDFKNCRRFPRSQFRGSAKATIYPPPSMPETAPVHCTVLTRDLSCGGIGLAHSRQLYPRQIVVLDALGKLLVGEVRWCRRAEEGFYVAGCRLVKTSE